MADNPYRILAPNARTSSVVVASPHSGRSYSEAFLRDTILDSRGIRSSEDAYIDLLLAEVPDMGAPLLLANAPRAWVDFNRSPEEMDAAVVSDIPRGAINPRVSSGLGVIPRVVANGRSIYRGKISRAEAYARIETAWKPYHAALQAQLNKSRATFGQAILIDVHSMPHEAIATSGRKAPPEIVLGDRFGASASDTITTQIEQAFRSAGFRVARNSPFAGAFIAQHYGRPSKGQHAVQIEIDRALYMDEARVEPNADFDTFRARLTSVMRDIVAIGQIDALPVAAE